MNNCYVEVTGKEKKSVVVQNAIAKIMKRYGKVTPQLLIDEASDIKHPLHNNFEWDDSEAARRYRIGQATQMILAQRFVVEIRERKESTDNGTHHVRRLLPVYENSTFKMRVDILNDKETRKILIDRKIKVLQSWCESVVDIEELSEIRENVVDLIK
jgi:hypothetical protein